MPDTFARMRQLVGSTVDWAANDLVIGLGEIAVERTPGGEFRIKVGDGVTRFSALPYASAVSTTVTWDNITGRPTTFPPSPHTHPPSDVTGLVDAGGKIQLSVIPQTLLDRMDWRGLHTPTPTGEYPLSPVNGDTWGIAGPAYTFTGGSLAGITVGQGSAITFDSGNWFAIGGGGSINPNDFVKVADLIEITTGPAQAGRVPKTNSAGRLDPSLINVPGALAFRGVVDITQPPPVGVNQGDYYLVGIGGTAHAGWTGIAGTNMLVNDQVIWNGVTWTFVRATPGVSGFVPLDGSTPMTGPLSLSTYPGGTVAPAFAIRRDYLDSRIAAIPPAVDQLGFVPLNPANNLSELTTPATARANLGLGTAATAAATDFLARLNNLSDLADKALARTNLGLGGAATHPDTFFLQSAQNLNDVPDKALARANLGIPDLTDTILKSIVDAAGDLIVGTAPDTVARLPRGTAGQVLVSTATSVAWQGAWEQIGRVVTTAGQTSIDFQNLPAGINDLLCFFDCAPVTNDVGFGLQMYDATGVLDATAGHYAFSGVMSSSAQAVGATPLVTAGGANTIWLTYFAAGSAIANSAGNSIQGDLRLYNIRDTTHYKRLNYGCGYSNAVATLNITGTGVRNIAGAISGLRLVLGSGAFTVGSVVSLWGY